MDLLGSLLTFTLFWKLSSGLLCYTCDRCPVNFTEGIKDKYLKPCKLSTMCFKRISTLDFGNGLTSQNMERGCAAQTQNGEQKKINGKWTLVNTIYEVYEEKCSPEPSSADRTTDTTICYCRGDRCNDAPASSAFIALRVIMVILLMIV